MTRSKPRKLELVLPAGDLNKARFAFNYGADACYGGLAKYSLRKAEVDFNLVTLKKAIDLAHCLGKKFYITFNIFARNYNLKTLESDIKKISKFKPDAFIVSDPGIINFIKKNSLIPIHLSTQANTTNWQSVKFWKEQGIKRIVLARELTLKEIQEIRIKVSDIELEIFVHGAMCISYSGRCLLSATMTGREANQGNCAQPCRWQYKIKNQKFFLEEEKRPGEYFEISEDKEGTYIMNSKDLRLIKYLPDIANAGVVGLKVEGRNKSEYYLSTITGAYRKAVNAFYDGKFKKILPDVLRETEKIAHRDYTTGFLFNDAKDGEIYKDRHPIENYKFLGVLTQNKVQWHKLIARNQIKVQDNVEVLTPDGFYNDKVEEIIDISGERLVVVNPRPPQEFIKIRLNKNYPANSMLRKINSI